MRGVAGIERPRDAAHRFPRRLRYNNAYLKEFEATLGGNS
jgi:hypothetical protein